MFTTTTKHVWTDEHGHGIELEFAPALHIDPKVTLHDDGRVEIFYATYDHDVEAPFADDDEQGVQWHGFDTKDEAAIFCDRTIEFGQGTTYRFSHDTHGPMSHNVLDPEGRFVLLLDNEFAPGVVNAKFAQSILDTYTAWQNGDTYSIVHQTELPDGNVETDIVGGYIGTDTVQHLVSEGGDI